MQRPGAGEGGARWKLLTPPPAGSGAIAAVAVWGEDVDGALARLGIKGVGVGEARLRSLAGVDEGIVARVTERLAVLTPHAGAAVLRQLAAALARAGIAEEPDAPAHEVYPEAATEVEARMLATLARAASPLAVDLLLDQPRRWAAAGAEAERDPEVLERSARLNRLIDPPTVVAVGAPNIGKSSLLNALAGRAVAIVADEPGTTRDHVGAALNLGGVVVRYIDAPGLGGEVGGVLAEAQRGAIEAAREADLVLLCGDAGAGFVAAPIGERPTLRVALRADLGLPREAFDVAVSVREGRGLEELVAAVRDRLVPPADRSHPGPWKFWR